MLNPAEALARGLDFIKHFRNGSPVNFALVDDLCRLAMSPQGDVARHALAVLYGMIIEGLCDDFSTAGVEICNEVLIRVLEAVRATPQGREMDQLLSRLGLDNRQVLTARYQRLQRPQGVMPNDRHQIRKCVIASRVTIGADIAITSVMARRVARLFPQSEIVLVGPGHLRELFGAMSGVKTLSLPYDRCGDLFARTTPWCSLYNLLEEERRENRPEELLYFDSDSRLTQLGMLPLGPDQGSYFFCSRFDHDENRSLTALVNDWFDQIFGRDDFLEPRLFLPAAALAKARFFRSEAKKKQPLFFVMNLGVGNDEKKRIPAPFEERLLQAIAARRDAIVLLDSGCTESGLDRVKAHLLALSRRHIPTAFITEPELTAWPDSLPYGVVGFRGSLTAIGALIAEADCFFGYDSCCQHMAVATKTPAVIAFAGHPHRRFLHRWSPSSDSKARIVEFGGENAASLSDIDNAVSRVIDDIYQLMESQQE